MNIEKWKREELILLSLKKLDFLSRSQIQKIHRLGGVRNANKILKEMEPYLSSHRAHEKIYYLSKEGRERVDCQKIRRPNTKLNHYLMRNDLYIFFGFPSTWQNEVKITHPDISTLIADAVFIKDKLRHCVEIDHEQKMNVNQKKIEQYKKLAKITPIKLIWFTTTDFRRKKLISLCDGLNFQVLTNNDIQ